MKVISKLINAVAKTHANRFTQALDRQTDPRLFKAIMTKINNKISSITLGGTTSLNPEQDLLEGVLLQGLGLGELDNIIDLLRYGRYALNGTKYKLAEYLLEYRQALSSNMPALNGRGFIFDLRKGAVSEQEVNTAMRKIFLKS